MGTRLRARSWGVLMSHTCPAARQVSTGKMTLVTAQPKLSSTKTFRFSQVISTADLSLCTLPEKSVTMW